MAPSSSPDAPVAVPLAGPRGISRRRFLAAAGATAGAVAATAYIRPSWLLGGSAGASEATGNVVVHLFLRGGADGLALVAPLGDSRYQQLRTGIAIADAQALPLDSRFGLHPAAVSLKSLYDQGRVAVIPAAGSPNSSRSHFEAQDLIEKGTPNSPSTPDGWFGRWMNETANSSEETLRGLGIGSGLQASLRGSAALSTPDLASLDLDPYSSLTWADDTNAEMNRALTAMYGSVADPLLKAQSASALQLIGQIGPIASASEIPADWPQHFGPALWPLARLLKSGFPIEAAGCDMGGWDLHDNIGAPTQEWGSMRRLVAELDAAIGAFFSYLGQVGDKVTVVVMSEFGRRIAVNGSGGTDHGRGQVMFVVGGGVSGGVKGDWPGLVDTDQGDVRVVNDYRLVIAEVLERRMRSVDMGKVFPGFDASSSRWLGVTTADSGGRTAAALAADALPPTDVAVVGDTPSPTVSDPEPMPAPDAPSVPMF